MPDDPLPEDIDTGRYDRFAGPLSRQDLDRYCFLDDADMKLVAKRRGDANRLGFSLQLVTVRYLGTFLADPLDVPTEVVDYVAEQLGISDPSCLKAYMGREKTRFEHQWEIAREDDWRDFAGAEDELVRWIDGRAWITGDGPRTLFDAAVGWLRERQVLLPAASTLERLAGRVGEEASQRFWNALATIPTPAQAGQLEVLLEVAPGSHFSDLDRLRHGPVMASGRSLALSLDRVAQIAGFGFGDVDLSAVPRRRVMELARYGMAGKATLLRRHPKPRKLATLLATVVHLQAKAIDDALELFDFLMVHELLASAQRTTKDETLRRYPQVSQNAGKLAAAMEVLVRMRDSGATLDPEAIWQAVERVVSWTEIRTAVESLRQVVPAPGEDPDAAWRGALVGRYLTVSRFLPKLVATIDFGATAGARPVLEAFQKLPALLAPGAAVDVPARHLAIDKVAADLVLPAWRRLVFPPARPEGTVHRAGYVFCILEQFHQRLVHRDIFGPASSRWADPQAQLLSGTAWEAVKDQVLNALQLSEDPTDRLAQLATDLDIEELVLEVMAWLPAVIEAFTAVSGGETRMVDLNVTLAAVLVSRALNIGYGPVISHRVEALTRARISHVDQTYTRNETLGPANGPIFDHQARVPLASDHWGGGQVAAADGVRFVVPVRSIHARPNPKYFGRRRGVTWLNLVNDRSMGTAAMVVALNLLDIDYRPEPADLPDTKLWHIDRDADYGALATAARGRIDLAKIKAHWPDLVRIAGSIHTGAVSAHDVIRMLSRGGGLTQLGEALAHYGRIFKTLHILSYVDVEPYRRQNKRMRNLQEGRHDLARHLFHGRRGDLYGLPGGDGGPVGRPRPGAEHGHALEHRLSRRRRRQAAGRRPFRPGRGRCPPVGLHPGAYQRPRAPQLRAR